MRVAEQMGHSDWTMIARFHGRWISAQSDAAGIEAVTLLSNPSMKDAEIRLTSKGKVP